MNDEIASHASRRRPVDLEGRLASSGELRMTTELTRIPMSRSQDSYFEDFEFATRPDIAALQFPRLQASIRHALEHSALYQKLWKEAGTTVDEIVDVATYFKRAPMIDKDILRQYRDETNDPFGGILCNPFGDLSVVGSSGGTTGDPTLCAERWGKPSIEHYTPREYWHAGVRPGDYVALMIVTMRPPGQRFFQDLGIKPLLFNHDPRELPRLIEWCRKFRPSVLMFVSSIMLNGLEKLEKEGADIKEAFSSLKMCVYGGEPLAPRAKANADRWGLKLYAVTTPGDIGVAVECSMHDGHHIWEDHVLAEVLDPQTLEPVPDGGRGELVVTSLHDQMMPLLRYRSGDLVRYTTEPCKCGRTHMRFWPLGRAGDEVVVNGKAILPIDIWPIVESLEETSSGLFQIVRPARDLEYLTVRIGYSGLPNLSSLSERLAHAFHQALGLVPVIQLVPDDELLKLGPPHKIPRIAKR
jgi:phenylacetate-CoA ligase